MVDHKKNADKYDDYHQGKGHNTDKCFYLKKLIEMKIKAGKINEFVRVLRDKLKKTDTRNPRTEKRYQGEVKTISGGSAIGLNSKTSRKRYARQVYNLFQFSPARQAIPRSFTEEDYEDAILPHEDPLVINPIIGENKIWNVMIDRGISENILFHRTYTKMNLAGQKMEPCREAPLEAFGRQHIPCEGTITLPILIGKMPYTVEKLVKFYIVIVETQYNALIGRPFLSAFQAVESIPQLKLKFPRKEGRRKEKRVYVEQDESTDSDSHHKRRRMKVVLQTDSDREEEDDVSDIDYPS
ncbi:uncharacterized protein LOC141674496 [Apium graveolens]|uniref:uncharacterized protein LOC141674496 n=1 Tax=Apium graveolens TaxID=4045 RepID=UPI003D7A7C62